MRRWLIVFGMPYGGFTNAEGISEGKRPTRREINAWTRDTEDRLRKSGMQLPEPVWEDEEQPPVGKFSLILVNLIELEEE